MIKRLGLLFILIFTLPAIGQDKVQLPTTRVTNCTNGPCHSNQLDFRFLHGPTAAGACNVCHVYLDGRAMHGLVGGCRRIEHGQSNHPKAHATAIRCVCPSAAIVRATMAHSLARSLQRLPVDRWSGELNDPADSAHIEWSRAGMPAVSTVSRGH